MDSETPGSVLPPPQRRRRKRPPSLTRKLRRAVAWLIPAILLVGLAVLAGGVVRVFERDAAVQAARRSPLNSLQPVDLKRLLASRDDSYSKELLSLEADIAGMRRKPHSVDDILDWDLLDRSRPRSELDRLAKESPSP